MVKERPLERLVPGLADLEATSPSPAMRPVWDDAKALAPSKAPVLLLGETGVGKSVLARAMHVASGLEGPFVEMPCGSFTPELFASALFGHVKGAFTSAHADAIGFVQKAHLGTLFLDELFEVPPEVQRMFLSFVEGGVFYKVGSAVPLRSDCRILTATNRDPEEMVEQRQLRPDLLHRFGAERIVIPPLCRRREDILPIARSILAACGREMQRTFPGFAPEVEALLREHRWPGNVRELSHVVRGAALRTRSGPIRREALRLSPEGKASSGGGADKGGQIWDHEVRPATHEAELRRFERTFLLAHLSAARGNVREAAARAGKSLSWFYGKLHEHGLRRRGGSAP